MRRLWNWLLGRPAEPDCRLCGAYWYPSRLIGDWHKRGCTGERPVYPEGADEE